MQFAKTCNSISTIDLTAVDLYSALCILSVYIERVYCVIKQRKREKVFRIGMYNFICLFVSKFMHDLTNIIPCRPSRVGGGGLFLHLKRLLFTKKQIIGLY